MIRAITTQEDLWLTRELAQGFFDESKLPGELDFNHWIGQWLKLFSLDIGGFLVYESDNEIKGMLGGFFVENMMTRSIEAIEAFWYVKENYRGTLIGIKLLKAFENEARKRNAVTVRMAHLSDLNANTMSKMYLRMQYQPLECYYTKELQPLVN